MEGLTQAELIERIAALKRALARGVRSVREKDRQTDYKSTREMLQTLEWLESELAEQSSSQPPENRRYRTRTAYNKGV